MNFPIDFEKLISTERIFEITPDPIGNYLYLLILSGLLLAVAIYLKIFKRKIKKNAKVFNALGNLFIFFSLTSAVIIFFRWQSIPYLGSRFAFMIVLVASLLWLLNILFYIWFELPQKKKLKIEREKFEKYLPRKKVN